MRSRSKIGPHCLIGNGPAAEFVRAGCRIVKLVSGALGMANEILSICPDVTIVGRVYTERTAREDWIAGISPEVSARNFFDSQVATYHANPSIKIFEGFNEPSFGDIRNPAETQQVLDGLHWYGRHEAERLRLLHAEGLRGTVGQFSVGYPEIVHADGSPDLRSWHAFLPALRAANLYRGILNLHEYAAPYLHHWTFRNAEHNEDWGWLLLRYRQVYRLVLEPNLFDIPIVISECGHDAAGGGNGLPTGNWRDLIPFWASRFPISAEFDAETFYASEFIDMDRLYWQRDDYLLGVTPFTFGTDNATWEKYRVDNAPGFISALVNHIRNAEQEPPPMAFSLNQIVYTTGLPDCSVKNENDQTLYRAAYGTRGRIINGSPRTIGNDLKWQVDLDGNPQDGWITESNLSATPSAPPSHYTQSGKWKPLNHHTLPLMENPDADSQLANINADEIPGLYLVYDSPARWARGRNWYHTTGLSVTGARYSPAGWFPCWWRQRDNTAEIYPSDGKPHPDCDQQVVDVPPDVPPPPPPPGEPPAIDPPVGAPLFNGGFEGGHANAPSGVSGLMPKGWILDYLDGIIPGIAGQTLDGNSQPRWYPPEVMVHDAGQLSFDLLPLPEGSHIFHLFGAWKPVWARLIAEHDLHLKPGHGRLSGVLFFDPVVSYDGGKSYGGDPLSAEFRMGLISDNGDIAVDPAAPDNAFLNGGSVPYGHYKRVYFDVASNVEGDFTPFFEFRGRHGLRHDGFFVDDLRIEWIDDEDIPPVDPPDEPPDEPPVDQPSWLVRLLRWLLDLIEKLLGKIGG